MDQRKGEYETKIRGNVNENERANDATGKNSLPLSDQVM
jgi:hypothetical protein